MNIIKYTLALLIIAYFTNGYAQKGKAGEIQFSNHALKESKLDAKSEFELGEDIYVQTFLKKTIQQYQGEKNGSGFGFSVFLNGKEKRSGGHTVKRGSHIYDYIYAKSPSFHNDNDRAFYTAAMYSLINSESYKEQIKVTIKISVWPAGEVAEGSFNFINVKPEKFKTKLKSMLGHLREYNTSSSEKVKLTNLLAADVPGVKVFDCYWNDADWSISKNYNGIPLKLYRYATLEILDEGKYYVLNLKVQREHLGGGKYAGWDLTLEGGGGYYDASKAYINIGKSESINNKESNAGTIGVQTQNGLISLKPVDNVNRENGEVIIRYADGEMKSTENYLDGEKHGVFVTTHEPGVISIKEEYVKGIIQSSECYFENGQLKWNRLYSNGKIDGESEEYWNNGNLKCESTYKDGMKVLTNNYSKGGNLSEAESYDLKGNKHGTQKYFYASDGYGIKKNGDYDHGAKEGKYTEYHKSGLIKVEGAYVKGKKDGMFKTHFDEDGSAIEKSVTYAKGLKDGELIQYFRNGKVRINTSYLGGKKNGLHVEYGKDGKKIRGGIYKNNNKDGSWVINGEKVEYENGKKL